MYRVLVLTPWYPMTHDPGWGVFVREHARAVARHAEVLVLHTVGPVRGIRGLWELEEETDPALTAGLPTHRLRSRSLPSRLATYTTYVAAVHRALLLLRARGFSPDVMHAHGYDPGFPAILAGRLFHVPVVISEHYSAFPLGQLDRRQIARARYAFARAHRVLPVSRALEEAIRDHGIEAHYEVVPNAVDLSLFHPRTDVPEGTRDFHRFLFVGRMDPIKRIPLLLEALAGLKAHPRAWRLELVGDGPQRQAYEHHVQVLGLAERVMFRGILTKPQVAARMREADALVLPSRWENAPCVVIEAFASGLPVIATRVGGIPELVDGDVGQLVDPDSAPALARALQQSLEGRVPHDPSASVERARAHGHDRIGRRLHEIFSEVVTQ